ncbi:MAG: phospho-sugar mutase, partial [Neisseriaceae bacterium]|nr:phospho-sugar mutase [Neisseriaceae bacterium]
MKPLLEQAQNWLNQDPDTETRQQLKTLIERAKENQTDAQNELKQLFTSRLQFGTAGLRGRLQAGCNGMNRVLVMQTAKGLADYLLANHQQPSIVIGYDGRKNSAIFAQDTAQIMAGAGIKTLLLPRPLPTPVLAFALRYFDCHAGVMVTASHNPAHDNGYKVYLGKQHGGGQIVSPIDAHIAEAIDLAAQININDYPKSDDFTVLDETVIDAYVAATAKIARAPKTELNFVYTALHGVGKDILLKTFQAAQLPLPHIVAEQAEPDAQFPTVVFPNPEEKGALDLAFALAKQHNAELIIANDPDADRFAVALPDEQGNWHSIHGNLIGCYLAWYVAQQAKQTGKQGALACSLVSTPALAKIAQHYDLTHEETFTGFKYIAKVKNMIYGFEESLGYLVDPEKVADKDGISAAVAFVDLVCQLKAAGKSLHDYIQSFTETFGAFDSTQISLRFKVLDDIAALMNAFRQAPPQAIGTQKMTAYKDYINHQEPHNILVYHLNNGNRVIIRPSGTEPKVKVYLDVVGKNAQDAKRALNVLENDMRELLRQE